MPPVSAGADWTQERDKLPKMAGNAGQTWALEKDRLARITAGSGEGWGTPEPSSNDIWYDALDPFETIHQASAAARILKKEVKFRIITREDRFVIQFKE